MRRKPNSSVYGAYRSEIGRRGKGESALSGKPLSPSILKRIERIVAMAERADCTLGRSRLLRLPIKGVKF